MRRAVTVLLLAMLARCGEAPVEPSVSGAARRVVSLSPAITATLVELGAGDRVVGRTPWCEGASMAPVVGSLTEIDLERLTAASPDLILVQRVASGPPPGLREAAERRGWRVAEIPCNSLDDVRGLTPSVAAAIGEASRPALEVAWRRALAPVPSVATASPVVLLFSAEPPQAFGRDTFLAQAWRAWGGSTLPDTDGHPQMGLEDLFALAPRTIVLIGAQPGAEVLAQACAARGVSLEVLPDARLLRPGPALREGLTAWRTRLEGPTR